MDVEDLIRTDQTPEGSPAVLIPFTESGTMFRGVIVSFPCEIPIDVQMTGGDTVFGGVVVKFPALVPIPISFK